MLFKGDSSLKSNLITSRGPQVSGKHFKTDDAFTDESPVFSGFLIGTMRIRFVYVELALRYDLLLDLIALFSQNCSVWSN